MSYTVGCDFIMGVTNYRGIDYCDGQGSGSLGCSVPPRNIVTGPGGNTKRDLDGINQQYIYMLASGATVAFASELEIGSMVSQVIPLNATLWAQQLADHVGDPDDDESQYDWMMDNLDIVDNAIVAAM